jgi:hypothetical protein
MSDKYQIYYNETLISGLDKKIIKAIDNKEYFVGAAICRP